MTDESMLVRIRGEVARRIREESAATGAPFTAIVDRRLKEVFAELDRRREYRERGTPHQKGTIRRAAIERVITEEE